jgi:acetyltransferase-like isoleucine patch superfamily enzyme
MDNRIYLNVQLGDNVTILPPCVIGMPPIGREDGELPTVIGAGAVIRPFTTIYAGTTIGAGLQTGQGACIREGNVLGDNVSVGTHAVLEVRNRIGSGVRIHSGCFLEDVKVGDFVFIGPNVTFTDDPHPMKCPHYLECGGGATVEDYVKIGANTTILPAVRLGRHALIGAGTVIVRDVREGTVVVGNPGREIGTIEALRCTPGYFPRPYVWEPYSSDPGSPVPPPSRR